MATNVNIYVPNVGEIEALEAVIRQKALILGLYKTAIIPDGNTVIGTIVEMPTGGGRGYAQKELTNDIVRDVLTANKWFLSTNALGKAEGAYNNAVLTWAFTAVEVADANTVFGVFGYCRVLDFTAGLQPIQVGDVIYQGSVCAEVTGVELNSGSWAAGTAAGKLTLKRQVGTFIAGATLIDASKPTSTSSIKELTATPVAAGTGYVAGDRFKIGTGTGGVGRVVSATGGVVTAVELLTGGEDYTVATHATTKIDGAGDNALTVAVASLYTAGPAVAIATIAGDSEKKLMATWAFASGVPITVDGQTITWDMKLALASGV